MTHLSTGDKAPYFETTNEKGEVVKLSDFLGKKLVLFFYPKDNTPTCTNEACNLRDNYKKLQQQGYEVLGVSPDSERKHTNFIEKFDLPYSLLADTDKKIINDYGVWGPKQFMGREVIGVYRTTFLIDEKGFISSVIKDVKSKQHASQILEEV